MVKCQLKWRASLYNYLGFKNAIAQLKLRIPGLDASGICPNKIVDGRTIRDPLTTDPALKIPLMLEKFGEKGYESDGEPDFPW